MFAKNKILIISSVDYFGGTRTYLENLLRFYGNYRVDLTLVANNTTFSGKINDLLKKHDFHSHIQPGNGRIVSKIRALFPVVGAVIDLISINKLVKQYEPNLLVITPFEPIHYFVSLLLRVKKILVVHSYPSSKLSIFFRILSKFSSGNYQLLTVSKAALDNIKQYWPPCITKNSSYLYNPPNHVNQNNKTKKNIILTMGHLEWYKDPITWLDTAELVIKQTRKPVCFEWRGDGSLKNHLLVEIKKRGLSNNVFIKAPSNDLNDLYSRTLIYFQPSIVESQGISVITAQSLGIPCVVTNVGGLPEMIINGKTGYVADCKNFSQMASSIISLINNHKKYEQLSNNSKFLSQSINLENKWKHSMLNIHQLLRVQL